MTGGVAGLRADALPVTLGALLDRAAVRHGDREAVVSGRMHFTYRQHAEQVNRVAWELRQLTGRRGDHVATRMSHY